MQLTHMYLACSHLDHDRGNNEPANLKALCLRWLTYRRRKAVGDLFLRS
ncbi:hypothetical protein [Methylobacterium platani]|nr:hypothetical protein [Methylobacterium platani]